jgi:hypothetical protein
MRRPISRYDMLLQLLGSAAKALFIGMFICTVLVVLAAIFGAGTQALIIYWLIWAFFWRSGLSLMAVTAVVTLLDSWQ